jgi:hypothetical protein
VAKLAIDFLRDPGKLSAQRAKLDELVSSLDHPGASMNVAKMALEMLDVDKKKVDADRLTGARGPLSTTAPAIKPARLSH